MGWEFNAPSDTELAGYTLYRSSVGEEFGFANRASFIYHDAPVFDGAARRYSQELCTVYVMGCSSWGDARYPLAPTNRYEKGSIDLDTTSIANGTHLIAIAVTDAGGNRTTSTPVSVTVRNPGAANGAHASRFAQLEAWFETRGSRHRTSATTSYGRTRAILGQVVDESGVPITDAVLDISATAARPGASTRALGAVATDASGRFRYLPRSGSSRRFTIGYRAFHLDDAASATATLSLNVRAGITLAVSPRQVSPRGRIEFAGRLRGGPGKAGSQVVINAVGRRTRDRIPVATVRANAKGRFHYRYRLPAQFARSDVSLHRDAALTAELSIRDRQLTSGHGANSLTRRGKPGSTRGGRSLHRTSRAKTVRSCSAEPYGVARIWVLCRLSQNFADRLGAEKRPRVGEGAHGDASERPGAGLRRADGTAELRRYAKWSDRVADERLRATSPRERRVPYRLGH